MFNNYEIKTINNEEVLFLYLDNNTEFATLRKKGKKKDLSSSINEFLKKKKITFKGKKIILVASGILVGACLISTHPKKDVNLNYNYTTHIVSLNETFTPETSPEKVVEELTKVETKAEETTKETVIKKAETTKNATTSKTPVKNTTTSKTPTAKPSTSNKENSTTPPNNANTKSPSAEKPSTPTSPVVSTGKMITVKRSNGTILNIELEEYLIGVVAAEMPASFSTEALKAQTIAARTYALKAIENNITLTDTTSTQVYKDNNQLKQTWGNSFNTYYNKIKNAVNATSGLVMYYGSSLINAYYHSTSNGYTEDSTAVFGTYPYLKSVESPVDKNVSSYLKTIALTYEDISSKLGIPVTSLSTISMERNTSNRISKIIIDNNTYDGVKFRTILGLRSTDFDITLNENNITITTRGYGHGVGMSQYGANEYAKLDWNYAKILKHYYTGITIKKY